ncbi:MAG: HamA C-terminal domain-containing protein [Iodobacter sp.]
MNHPDYFLEVVFHEVNKCGEDLALCAGFERGDWRNDQLADHVMEWLPEFALSQSELSEIGHQNAVRITKKAAKLVYQTEKYGLRGEFGEILLHIAIRQVYKTIPAVSKIYYKTALNETVKGFDAVHVVKKDDGLELWIGETKFYKNVTSAIYDVAKEIVEHLETDYLKSEFMLIKNKIDPDWPEAELLNELLNGNTSLDKVFQRVCIPILLTYESSVVKITNKSDDVYVSSIRKEINECYKKMREKLNDEYKGRFKEDLPITVHVILIPLKDKKALIASLDTRLKAMQL